MIFNPLRFAAVYFGAAVAIVLISYLLETYAGVNFSATSSGVIAALLAAMIEGQKYIETTRARPAGGLWLAAAQMTGIIAVLSIAQIGLLYLASPETIGPLGGIGLSILALIALVVLLFTLLVCRLGYGLGLRAGAKTLNK